MPDNSKFEPSRITVVNYKMIKGQVDSPSDFVATDVTGFNLVNDFELGFNVEDKLVKADYSVDIKTATSEGTNNAGASGSFHFEYIFKIDNLEELAIPEADTIKLDAMLGNALASIAYSTSRGVLLTRLQGTALQNFVLPVIDANQLLKVNKQEL